MRPKPFKFFFALALGIMVFFVVARLVIGALFIAAILSVLFFLGKKIKNFFYNLNWREESDYYLPQEYRTPPTMLLWKEDFFTDFSNRKKAYQNNYRVIEIL